MTMIFAEEASLFISAVRRYFAGSFKLSCNDSICELKRQFEDPYESSQSMIYSPELFIANTFYMFAKYFYTSFEFVMTHES